MSLSIHNATFFSTGTFINVVKSDIQLQFFNDILKIFNVVIHFFLDKTMSLYNILFMNYIKILLFYIYSLIVGIIIGTYIGYLLFK